jgi:CBS domain-containing protein
MIRRDEHLNGMLRHLGAAYYESLHGRASRADVARALDAIEEHDGERPGVPPARLPAPPHAPDRPAHPHHKTPAQHHGRWHHRVRDVMTTDVVTVDRITPYKEIAALLAGHGIGSVPVLILGRHVAGVVSDADLLAAQDERERAAHPDGAARPHRPHLPHRHDHHLGLVAEELMTSPAVTIHPDATLPAAARLLNSHHLKRLPVVNPDGTLCGIVSRCDLLSVFLRPDAEIAGQVREMLDQVLLAGSGTVTVRVHNGVVTLGGQPSADVDPGLVPVAVRLTWDIDGVVDVIDEIGPRR